MHKIIPIFLIVALISSMLTIGQLGKILDFEQLNEEVCEQGNPLLDEKGKDFKYIYGGIALAQQAQCKLAVIAKIIRVQHNEEIPACPSSDILMPPPKVLPA